VKILYVAYPLLPVSDNSAGGAEQMLWTLSREMTARGHKTSIAACAGSKSAGEMIVTGDAPRENDAFERRDAEHCAAVIKRIQRRARSNSPFDLVHDKSGSFWCSANSISTPVLVTLHLPRHMYRAGLFDDPAENVYFNCVSQSQATSFNDLPRFVGVVQNGIAVERFPFQETKCDYLLWIGRICEEKGPHIAIRVAERARLPLVMAGAVYPFTYHQQYFAREIAPRLADVTYVEWPTFDEKLVLLQNARAVLLTSTVNETSSLVAMEAMACGTPVIAFHRGAFPEIVQDGVTGFIVDDMDSMLEAIEHVRQIQPHDCRVRVEREFSASRMARDYEHLYDDVVHRRRFRVMRSLAS
jgi:glycosyltransferase involved in cell wall biosynthesis